MLVVYHYEGMGHHAAFYVGRSSDHPTLPKQTVTSRAAARAASGHANAAPPSSVMNSRRLIVAPRAQNHAPHRLTAVRVLERGEGDVNCDQLFWAGNVGSGSHNRGQNRKTQTEQMFSQETVCALGNQLGMLLHGRTHSERRRAPRNVPAAYAPSNARSR